MKITIYTTTDCQFSKQEKEYLMSHSIQYEEKNLETDKNFLTEMLAISNNFAGTPVTRVEKDDGSIAVLKGFTKEEFDTTLGLTPVVPTPPSPTPVATTTEEPPKVEETAPVEVVPPVEVAAPVSETPAPPIEETPAAPVIDPELNSVLDKLKEETAAPQPAVPSTDNPTPTAAMPNIPEPDFK
jgi:glutaredoxin